MVTSYARRLTAAVFLAFFANGALFGAWGGSLPALRDRVGTDATGIGFVLVTTGLAGILSMQIGGRVSDRLTPRLPMILTGFLMATGVAIGSFATNYAMLIIAAIFIGGGNGTMDVAMNALGVEAEKARNSPVMSRFHAFFSLGGFVGSALVLLLARLSSEDQADPRTALLIAVTFAIASLCFLLWFTPHVHTHPAAQDADLSESGPHNAKIPPQVWALGIMALFFGFTEGTAMDWASIHVTDVAHVNPGTGAAGLVAVSISMVGVRLLGDALVSKLGRVTVVRFGAPLAVLGFAIVSLLSALPVILIGWLMVGFGVGLIAPQIYAIAGHIGGGRVLAIVTGFGYTAFLAGPGLMGFLSSQFGIQHAMFLPLLAGCALTALTFTKALNDPTEA